MKFIIEETGQVIEPKGRKFYYPPWDKWVEDKYLIKYPPDILAQRYGIYELKEVTGSYGPEWYKLNGYTDVKDGFVITRTYKVVPKYGAEVLGLKNKKVKQEGICLYAQAIKIEPLLLFTGDNFDLDTYKAALIAAYNNAKTEVMAIVNNGALTQRQKYDQVVSYKVAWPNLPFTEEELADYGCA